MVTAPRYRYGPEPNTLKIGKEREDTPKAPVLDFSSSQQQQSEMNLSFFLCPF